MSTKMINLNSSFWDNRPTLVTGATGLLGGWLVKRLLSMGADVVCVIRDSVPQSELIRSGSISQVKVVHGDVCDRVFLERVLGEYEIDTVMHLAAQTIVGIANRHPISTFETNIAGTWQMLEACRHSPTVKQIVMASSDKAYGDCDTLPYVETTPLQGLHPYDVSKSCADLIAQAYGHTYNLPVAITRCGNFFGGGDLNWNRIIPGTIRSILQEEAPVIRSNGSCIRDYIYVEDGASAYILLAEQLAKNPDLYGQAFNFSNETQITVLNIVNQIINLMGTNLIPIIQNQATNEIQHQFLDTTKAKNVLGWKPEFTLVQGLKQAITWYEKFLDCRKSTNNLDYSEIESFSVSNLAIQQVIHN
jgi:CDP-glucose 4,6-dehydratase